MQQDNVYKNLTHYLPRIQLSEQFCIPDAAASCLTAVTGLRMGSFL